MYIFKRLLSSQNEKKLNVIEMRFQLNVTRDTKCVRLHKEHLKSDLMLPTKLNKLSVVRPRENFLRRKLLLLLFIHLFLYLQINVMYAFPTFSHVTTLAQLLNMKIQIVVL